jgi:hypothetical protein
MHLKSSVIAAFALVAIVSSCDKDDPAPTPDPNVAFAATINGASEVPANSSTATGSATATFNKDTKILTLDMTYTGLTATNMHIHKGPAGVSGGVLYGISSAPFSSPVRYVSPAFTAGQEDSLMNNLYYLNIHSALFPGGEIRGQILKK